MFVLLFVGVFALTYATGTQKRPGLRARTSWIPLRAAHFPTTPDSTLIADNRLESFWR
jgi:hypothetical protein